MIASAAFRKLRLSPTVPALTSETIRSLLAIRFHRLGTAYVTNQIGVTPGQGHTFIMARMVQSYDGHVNDGRRPKRAGDARYLRCISSRAAGSCSSAARGE